MQRIFVLLVLTILTLTTTISLNAQWIQQDSGTNAMLSDVVMLDTATVIAVGRNGSILRTTNSGATWIDVAAPLSYIQPWSSVSFFDTTNGAVVGDHGVVLTTVNGGKNWSWRAIPGGQKCLSVLHVGPSSMYVGADSGWVYHTSDTGKTWISEKISTWPVRSLFVWRGPSIIGVSKYALTPYSLCTQYVIPPPSWGESILPNFQGLGSAAFDAEYCNGGGAGFIVGVQGDLRSAPAILRKSISDTAWRNVSTGIFRDGTFLSVSATSATVICVCGSNGMIYRSSNGGDTWIDQTVPTMRSLNAVYFYDEKRGFVVGDSGLILKTSNGGVTSVDDPNGPTPSAFMLEQNYPNPFNPATNFEFRIANVEFATLKVFDVLGCEVATLVNEVKAPGSYKLRWDASSVSSGIYFYRLQTREFVETKKMILLK